MVKQAEKIRQRNPLLPIFGLIIAIGLFVVAMYLVKPISGVITKVSGNGDFVSALGTPIEPVLSPKFRLPSTASLGVAFAIWLILLALTYTLVAVLAGRDPNSAKNIQLPPRTKEEKNRRL